ncbi:hypothetical protein K438DRAFT_1813621 [Mycena galopus ATCC 62051]|nr:hypothetical protein K438DRAFT_1813621 [Mycena galopus ATCC 62051]
MTHRDGLRLADVYSSPRRRAPLRDVAVPQHPLRCAPVSTTDARCPSPANREGRLGRLKHLDIVQRKTKISI